VTCAEHQAKLGGGLHSLLYHICDGPAVTKAMKISSKPLQISREGLMETPEKHKVKAIGFVVKDRTSKAQ